MARQKLLLDPRTLAWKYSRSQPRLELLGHVEAKDCCVHSEVAISNETSHLRSLEQENYIRIL